MSKRILLLIENLGSGGAERQLTGLAVMLKQKGYEVEVWYYVKKEFYLPFLQENCVTGRYLHDANMSRKRYAALKKYIKAYNPDTVISYSVSTSMIACMLKILGARFSLIVSERNTTQKITSRVKLRFFLYRWADYIVPNSYAQADFINSNFHELIEKVKVITNYVDTEKFSPVDHEVKPESDNTNIVCVGRMMSQKNIVSFIKVISRVIADGYKVKVDWFGHDLHDDYSAQCHSLVKEYSLEDVFRFHMPSTCIEQEYRKADVFCLPSLYEGFPNVLCEAMSCGKPVLCCRVSDNAKIVKDGINGLLFDPLSVDDMVSKIECYLEIPKEDQLEMGRISRKISIELFSKENFISKYCVIIS